MISACTMQLIFPPELTADEPDDVEANLAGWECGKRSHRWFGNYAQECLQCCRGAIYFMKCG